MKKRILFFFPVMVMMFLCSAVTFAQEVRLQTDLNPLEARTLAQKELPKVLQWIDPEDLHEYGFSMRDDFSKIVVGRAFYITAIDEVKALSSSASKGVEVKSMMLPLILDNNVRCFIYLGKEEGRWQAVGIGDKGYAVNNESVFNHNDDKSSVIVSIPQLTEDFVLHRTDQGVVYKPILHVNAQIKNEQYTLRELFVLFDKALENLKDMPF